jgi:2-amino-4-hydroxy-6-hydroxymethyldihydropteridine diphosphokinase
MESREIFNPVTCYLGLGSNIGDRVDFFNQAKQALVRSSAVTLIQESPIYETQALLAEGDSESQDPYLNQVIKIETTLSPVELHTLVKKIENSIMPHRPEKWKPRKIDIDILTYRQDVRLPSTSEPPHIPHPQIQNRLFVLQPLSDIAPPDMIIPVLNQTITQLREKCKDELIITLYEPTLV